MDINDLKRVVVIGTSCSGKTTFANHLAQALGQNTIQLDALYWLPEWRPRPEHEFKRLVQDAIAEEEWVLDGNYSRLRDFVWPRATTIIWLNYSFPVVMYRALNRTFRRSIFREPFYSGNRETLRRAFLSKDSILLWILKTYWRRRREYPELLLENQSRERKVIVVPSPQAAKRFLSEVDSHFNLQRQVHLIGVST
jgi:adenylate kinase family enzyme